jgi:hypothetical protein
VALNRALPAAVPQVEYGAINARGGTMRGWLSVVIGALLLVVGAIWALQGVGVLKGSVMTGVTLWAVVGPIVALGGLLLGLYGIRQVRHR